MIFMLDNGKEGDTDNLKSVKSFSEIIGTSAAFVYKLEKEKVLSFVNIDGVRFVDVVEHKIFLDKRKRDAIIRKIKKILKQTK